MQAGQRQVQRGVRPAQVVLLQRVVVLDEFLTDRGQPVAVRAGREDLWAAGIAIVFVPLAMRAYRSRV
ncbi:hypothetical protein ADK53_10085 [Streptomyces sp. WM6373]|uniref:hypothetical protein n=1 Tax=Streptomyces TaxID=1883 RepID=UPI0006AE6ACC|nr:MULTISPECIES: hypothetical protein [unclassified Streptomyces]KOU40286.1 hypothetical protein ADK53_10085 [Streptomyces sp. WM6373]KOU89519.1 hypothetical protein ADK93_11050 [Streptomyces sp. XY58]KOV08635.1 hypothetical protein ADK89_07765 [Streptomyces sp. XY37]KOV50762.1 hypothetical protein ADK99_09245 [Streptomyces sp. MMG1064]